MSHLTLRSSLIVYAWLVALTLLEVGLVFVGGPKLIGAIVLAASMISKALLILLFFMHVKYDGPLVWLLPGIPVVFAIIFVLALFPDIVYHMTLKMG